MKLKYYKSVFLISLFTLGICEISNAQDPGMGSESTPDSVKALADSVVVGPQKNIGIKQIGYAVQPASITTGSVSSVKGSDIEQNFNLNLGNALFGRIPGLWVAQGNSEPGVGTTLFLMRGKNTFGNAGTAPLIIVDGFIVGENTIGSVFSQLVPEEVESVTLLKDAASTAVYGNRGANGVLLVTTKRGGQGPLKISFNTRQGITQAFNLPEFLNAADYATLNNEARINDGNTPLYDDAEIAAYGNGSDPFLRPNVNWYNEVLRKTAPVSSYNLNLKGGDNTVSYFVMLNALSAQGLFKTFGDQDAESSNSKYNRYNFRSNVDVNLSKRLAVAFNLSGAVEQKVNPFEYSAGSTFNLLQTIPSNAFPVRNPNGSWGGNNIYANPVANLLATGFDQSTGRTLQTALRLTQQLDMLAKGLSISGVVSINNFFIAGNEKNKNYSQVPILGVNADGSYNYGTPIGLVTSLAAVDRTRTEYRNFELQGALNYDRTFGKHGLTGLFMINTDNEVRPFDSGVSSDPYRHNGLATRLTYVYNQKYIAEFSAGYMGTENYAPEKRYGFFPTGSAGWIVSKENFLKDNKNISFLKLRASYGLAGNENTGGLRYAYVPLYNTFFGSEGTLGNPDVTWEKEKSLNLGLDATLFNRLEVNFDVFNRQRYDILTTPNNIVPGFMGANLPQLNVGETSNKGFDLSIRFNSKQGGKLQYFVETNYSYYRNKIINIGEIPQLNPGLVRTGNTIDQPLRYRAIGFFTPAEVAARAGNPASYPAPVGVTVRPGDLKYEDVGGSDGVPDGIINNFDLVPVGNPANPRSLIGLNAGIRFKGFDLNTVFQAAAGNTVYLSGPLFSAFQNNGNVSPIALGRWTEATASTATYPRLSAANDQNNFQNSSFWAKNGDFIKLRSAELGYTLPKQFSSRVKLSTARLFLTGTNLFSIDKIEFGDPESLSGYPVMQTFVLGAKVQF